ncbi:NmrA family NAD(P)-binding protein [Streptomyces althioticus]
MNEMHHAADAAARAGDGPDLFVVTAATSDTGSAVVRALLDGGSPVVAVGRDGDRLQEYARLGARTRVSALDDAEGLAAALEGATGAFVMMAPGLIPVSEDFPAYQHAVTVAQASAVEAAHRRGSLRRVVTLSGWAANYPGARGPVGGAEEVRGRRRRQRGAGGPPAGGLLHGEPPGRHRGRQGHRRHGRPRSPGPSAADDRHGDIGRVAAEFLRGERPFVPGPVEVVGPAFRTLGEATRLIGAAVGAAGARYVSRSPEAVRAALVDAGFSDHMADGTVAMTLDVAEGRIRVLGTERTISTTTLEEWVASATA